MPSCARFQPAQAQLSLLGPEHTLVPTAVMRASGTARMPRFSSSRALICPRLRPVLKTSTLPHSAAWSSQYCTLLCQHI